MMFALELPYWQLTIIKTVVVLMIIPAAAVIVIGWRGRGWGWGWGWGHRGRTWRCHHRRHGRTVATRASRAGLGGGHGCYRGAGVGDQIDRRNERQATAGSRPQRHRRDQRESASGND